MNTEDSKRPYSGDGSENEGRGGESRGGESRGGESRFLSLHARYGSEIITVTGPDNELLYESASVEEMLGYRHAEEVLAAGDWFRYVHPEDMERLGEAVEGCLSAPGEHPPVEYRIKDAKGEWRWLESRGVNLLDDPEVGALAISTREITDRKRAEKAREESERRLISAFEEAPMGVAALDLEDRILAANPALCRMLGYPREELVGKSSSEITHPEDRAESEARSRRLLSGELDEEGLEKRYLFKNGGSLWARCDARLVRDAEGDPESFVCHVQDITDRKEAEEEARLKDRAVFASANGIIITDPTLPDNPIIYVNPRFEEITGYSSQEAEGRNCRFLRDPGEEQPGLGELREAVAEGREWTGVLRNHRKDGSPFWNELHLAPVHDGEGRLVNFVGIQEDITERVRAEEALAESEGRLRAVTSGAPIIMFAFDTSGTITFDAGRGLSSLGLAPGSSVGLSAFEIYRDDPRVQENLRRALSGEEVSDTVELRGTFGEKLFFDTLYSPLWAASGEVEGVVGVATDVTERRGLEEELRKSEARYRAAVEDQTELVSRFTADLELTLMNDAYCRHFGKSREELLGANFLDLIPPESRPVAEGHIRRLSVEEPVKTIEHRSERSDGEVRWMQWTDRAIFDEKGRVAEYQCVGRDVTERKTLEERLQHQALHDPLTGLPERELLTDRLRHALAKRDAKRDARRGRHSVAVLFVDVDDLKLVNDSLGHEAGDRLLVAVGERLRGCVREEDTVSRFGGDEFVVLLESAGTEEGALLVADRILERLKEPLGVNGHEVPLTASIGISLSSSLTANPDESAEDLVRHADAAMYRAKAAGGGTYATFDPEMGRDDLERLELTGDLRRAVERGELRVHYQHKVDLATGGVAGWEALLRWEHPERGTIEPGKFIPLAEESGLIVPIGKWVLEKACEQAKLWRERHPKEPGQFMSVNLSARQFSDPALEDDIERILSRVGFPASALDLEITESVLFEDEVSDFSRIRKLKELGLTFSLDDFGTGYSSLLSLKELPVDFIKVDRAFTERVPGPPEEEAFVTAMVGLARALSLEVVAEGIETEEQWRRLRELGCGYGQGYYFAPPLPPEEATREMDRLESAERGP